MQHLCYLLCMYISFQGSSFARAAVLQTTLCIADVQTGKWGEGGGAHSSGI